MGEWRRLTWTVLPGGASMARGRTLNYMVTTGPGGHIVLTRWHDRPDEPAAGPSQLAVADAFVYTGQMPAGSDWVGVAQELAEGFENEMSLQWPNWLIAGDDPAAPRSMSGTLEQIRTRRGAAITARLTRGSPAKSRPPGQSPGRLVCSSTTPRKLKP